MRTRPLLKNVMELMLLIVTLIAVNVLLLSIFVHILYLSNNELLSVFHCVHLKTMTIKNLFCSDLDVTDIPFTALLLLLLLLQPYSRKIPCFPCVRESLTQLREERRHFCGGLKQSGIFSRFFSPIMGNAASVSYFILY